MVQYVTLACITLSSLISTEVCQVRLYPQHESLFSYGSRARGAVVSGAPARCHSALCSRVLACFFRLQTERTVLAGKHRAVQTSFGPRPRQRQVRPPLRNIAPPITAAADAPALAHTHTHWHRYAQLVEAMKNAPELHKKASEVLGDPVIKFNENCRL